jgi:flagellin
MLDLNTNVSSLVAENSLNNTSNMLSTSLQRLSTGLKVNTGADGPAAYVISQEQQSQITGLQQAVQNTSEATSMVQTADGALGTINDLLNQMRSLALDSANSGVNDPNAQAANQAEVANALATIDRIATNTQFGTKQILNGNAGLTGTSTSSNVNFIAAQANVASGGQYAVDITTAAQKAVAKATTNTGALAQDETVTINGVNVALTQGMTQSQQIAAINNVTGQTGVTASDLQTTQTSAVITDTTGPAPATGASLLDNLDQNTTAYAASGDTITISGTDGNGAAVSKSFAVTNATTVTNLLTDINSAFSHATATINGSGQLVLTSAGGPAVNTTATLSIADGAGNTGKTDWSNYLGANATLGGTNTTVLKSNAYGSAQTITATSDVAASGTSSGIGIAGITGTGVDVAGTFNGVQGSGQGNILSGLTGTQAQGITVSVGNAISGAQGNVNVTDNSLVFQIGANANQTVKVGIDSMATDALGLNVSGNQFANLGQINIATESGAQDAIKIIDSATLQVSTLSGTLGAVQSQTLAETASNLQTTLTNTSAAEATIRDTNFAAETANFSQLQVMMQVGTSVLSNSNQLAGLVTKLFQ